MWVRRNIKHIVIKKYNDTQVSKIIYTRINLVYKNTKHKVKKENNNIWISK